MHPLRFPNSGIRAKVFVQKIGFKLRVMILNRVESFYAFLLRFCCEGSEEGWPAMASHHAGPATHSQATAKAPCNGGAGCGQGQPARETSTARNDSSPQGRPTLLTGAAARAAIRGQPYRQLQGWPPLGRVAADGQGQQQPAQGQQRRQQRRRWGKRG
ncbi:hypothetical protein GW17_00056293 [Ensete ventricosum]|nr:hypothetical protein GW17_00056293 [Ensete ventricosum]